MPHQLKILSAQQIRKADAYTIAHEPISSTDLMERAANACVDWFTKEFHASGKLAVVCGQGNNGGDGLVMARHLAGMGYSVTCFVVVTRDRGTPDFELNLQRLETLDIKIVPITKTNIPESFHCDILIDALFGSGLTRPVEGLPALIIDLINQSHVDVVSIDLPSGLFGEDNSNNHGAKVCATHTLALEFPKLSLFLPENEPYTGKWHVIPIGLSKEYIKRQQSDYFVITDDSVYALYKPRHKYSHKGSFGHADIIAGSLGKTGAAILATKACLRSGAGLVTAHIPTCGYTSLQTANPEVMVELNSGEHQLEGSYIESGNTIGVGPGIGVSAKTGAYLERVLRNTTTPMVLDADAINIIANNPKLLKFIPESSILTPHPGEFKRLVGEWTSDLDKLQRLKETAVSNTCYIVLKGAHTAIAHPDGTVHFNVTGNPGMATAGSGDVLTGILTGLLAQHYTPEEATHLGVYLHGLAGDLATGQTGPEAVIASDIIGQIGNAYKQIKIGSYKHESHH